MELRNNKLINVLKEKINCHHLFKKNGFSNVFNSYLKKAKTFIFLVKQNVSWKSQMHPLGVKILRYQIINTKRIHATFLFF